MVGRALARRRIPSRDPICLGPLEQTAMQKRRSQCDGGNTCRADSSPTPPPPGTRGPRPVPRRASARALPASSAVPPLRRRRRRALRNRWRSEAARRGGELVAGGDARALADPGSVQEGARRDGSSSCESSVSVSAAKSPSSTVVGGPQLCRARTESDPLPGAAARRRACPSTHSAMLACAAAVAFTRDLYRNPPVAPRFPRHAPRCAPTDAAPPPPAPVSFAPGRLPCEAARFSPTRTGDAQLAAALVRRVEMPPGCSRSARSNS